MNSNPAATTSLGGNPRPTPPKPWSVWLQIVLDNRWLLIVPALICFGLSLAYATLGAKQWRATQVFHLRDEMIGRQNRPGYFSSLDDMKTAQETILEIARNPKVVRRCLQTLQPTKTASDREVEEAQGAIQVSSANGAELGKTELIRLSVVDRSPEASREFCQQLSSEMETELRTVRFNRACSMLAELDKAADSAEASLGEIATQIKEFEYRLGPDLGDLRNLIEPTSGDNLLYRNMNQINTELRAAQVNLETVTLQRKLLQDSFEDVNAIVATPNELLNLQPALRRLKDGLVDAQLKLATLRGDYNDNHPKVAGAIDAVTEIQNALRDELGLAIRGLEDQMQILDANVAQLSQIAADTNTRLQTLTEQRIVYDQLNEEYKRRDAVLRDAQTEVAQAESIKNASLSVDLLTRVNDVQVSSRPEGPSKRTLVGSTTLLGLFIGFGLIMLLHAPQPQPISVPPQAVPVVAAAAAPIAPAETPARVIAPKILPRETVDQILDRGSFAVTVMPANFLLSKPHAE